MATAAGHVLQAAIYAALSAAPSIGATVYDNVPAEAAFPHIAMEGWNTTDWSASGIDGEEVAFEVHVWSRYTGTKEAAGLIRSIRSRLHRQAPQLTISEGNLVLIRCEGEEVMQDADLLTYHGIARFRAIYTY